MAVTWVQGAGSNSFSYDGTNTTISATFSASVLAGDSVLGGFAANAASLTIVSLTDDKNNTYNLENAIGDGSGVVMYAFSRTNVANAPSTITLKAAGNLALTLVIDEFSGTTTATPDGRDVHGGQYQASAGTGTDAVTSGTFTTVTDGELIYGITTNNGGLGNAGGLTVGSGFTAATTSPHTNFTNFQMNSEWMQQPTRGQIAATWTQGENDARETVMIAIELTPPPPQIPPAGMVAVEW